MTEANLHTLFITFGKILIAAMIIPIIAAIIQLKHLNKPLKIFLLYRIISLLFNLLENTFYYFAVKYYKQIEPYLTYWGIDDTSFLSILYQVNNIIFLGWFYYLLIPQKYGKLINRVAIFLFIAVVVNYLFIEGYQDFGKFNPNATAIFTFSIAAFYLWYLYKSYLTLPINKNPYFWLSIAVIIPYLIGFFLFFVGDITHEEDYRMFVILSIVKNSFLIIGQILMAIGFWQARYAKYLPLPNG